MGTIYVSDPWDLLSPGFSGAPPGWTLFGSSEVFSSDGAFPGHNYGAGFYNPLSSPLFADNSPSSSQIQVQVCFGAKLGGINNDFVFNISAEDITSNPREVFRMSQLPDNSLGVFTGGSPLLISSPPPPFNPNVPASTGVYGQYYYGNVWYYFTVQIQIQADPGGSGLLQVSCNLFVDGIQIFSAKNSVIPLANFPTTGSGPTTALNTIIDQCSWFGNQSFNTQVQISDWGVSVPDTTPPNDRISQMVVELPQTAPQAFVRVSQGVIEVPTLPIHAFCRISQMVIELITPNINVAVPFWAEGETMMSMTASWTDSE